MLRSPIVVTLSCLTFASVGLSDDSSKKPAPANPPKMIPNVKWIPKPGDVVQAYDEDEDNILAATDLFSFTEMVKYLRAKDLDGLNELADQKRLTELEHGTLVRVIERHTNPYLAKGVFACEIRVMEGKLKGSKFWVMEASIAEMIPGPKVESPEEKAAREKIARELAEKLDREKADRKARRDAAEKEAAIKARPGRAAALLEAAKGFQFDGNTAKALEYYRRIVKEFGDTPSAKEAEKRIKTLTGK